MIVNRKDLIQQIVEVLQELNVEEIENITIQTNNYEDETESLDIHVGFKKGV